MTAIVLAVSGYVIAGLEKLDEIKLDNAVFKQYQSYQGENFARIQSSLDKIEKKLGVYDPE